jgi:hypothetical protein
MSDFYSLLLAFTWKLLGNYLEIEDIEDGIMKVRLLLWIIKDEWQMKP